MRLFSGKKKTTGGSTVFDPSVQVNPDDFRRMLGERAAPLLRLAACLTEPAGARCAMTRPLLGELLAQASIIEELLDAYGARNNQTWFAFRSHAAAFKTFADAGYEILHIQHVLPSYCLRESESSKGNEKVVSNAEFQADTQEALDFVADVLGSTASGLLGVAASKGLSAPANVPEACCFAEPLPPGRLSADRASRAVETVAGVVTRLATAFLSLAAESSAVQAARKASPEQYADFVPNPVCEDGLRLLQLRFHNLQSLYDTYVRQTDTEGLDADLPVLRGHVSVVFHLLSIATLLTHYYERHILPSGCDRSSFRPPVAPSILLKALMGYTLRYAGAYITNATSLCQEMLRRYAQVVRIEVPVPRYRGFHVRPSTLVAKIVMHYGSHVRMELEGEVYDASQPLEIFRANEKINAWKRRQLACAIAGLPELRNQMQTGRVSEAVRHVVLALAEQGKLVLYEQPLQLDEDLENQGGTLLERLTGEIARLQAVGKIDICADLALTLVGDKRVLEDIRRLAQAGYGEDNFGNNIPLPEDLSYLRR